MIEKYIDKLIQNLPENEKSFKKIDLVLDGGIFNGSYLVGALYFLREMERKNYLKIERISGCSVGAIVGFLYYIDALYLMPELYEIIKTEFKNNFQLSFVKQLKSFLINKIPTNICVKINGKLFICYNDLNKCKKIVKSNFANIDEIIDTIIKSCYIPLLIDNKLIYKKRYIDGINPYIFKQSKNKKILHMELFSYDKFIYCLNIKNEKNNFHRILMGMLDVHSFFVKKSNTSMCSYVNNWGILNNCNYLLKLIVEKIIIYILILFLFIKKFLPKNIYNSLIVKITSKICFVIFSIILENYFL